MRIGIGCAGAPSADLLDLLEAAGLPAAPLRAAPPRARVETAGTAWLLASDLDVLRACDRGALDAGIVGKDRLLEVRRGVSELLDLRCCRDELVFATGGDDPRPDRRLRVATRYPESARRYFAGRGSQPDVFMVDEPALAIPLGLADGVIDLASRLGPDRSGAGPLRVRERIASCSARLVAGRAARALVGARLGELTEALRDTLEDR